MTPKITAILLTCNRTAYVRQALEGLRQQTYPDWTLTASDCSVDPKARAEISEVMEEYRRNDPAHEMRIIQQPERILQNEHLRRALLNVDTPYVALLDDDDIWMPNHLERACEWLDQNPRHGLAISNGKVIDADGVDHGWTNSREEPLPDSANLQGWLRLFMSSFYGSTSGFIFRREALAHHPFLPTPMVDIHVGLSVVLNDYQVVGFPEASYFYRVHGGSFYEHYSVPGSSLYDKGPFILRDRHNLRLWLFRCQGLRIIRKFPLFLFLVIKSAIAVAKDTFQNNTRKGVKFHTI
jgi:glycosyltransferase involved in cell wall biosynthesis